MPGEHKPLAHTRPPGRPPKLLDETVRTTLIDALKIGASIALACEAANVATSTFHLWMQRGLSGHIQRSLHMENPDDHDPADDDDEPYIDMFEAVQAARATAALRNVGVIQRVANGGTVLEKTTETDPNGTERVIEKRQAPDWRAAAWFLERSYKGEFRKEAEHVEITGAGGGPIELTADATALAKSLTEHIEAGAAQVGRPVGQIGPGPLIPNDEEDDDGIEDAEVVEDEPPPLSKPPVDH